MFESLFLKYPFFRYIPSILGMALLFKSSATSGSDISFLVPPMDKILHGLAYACLGFSFSLWFKPDFWKNKTIKAFFFSVLFTAIYGISDELHQSFVPGRDASVGDFLADTVGGFAGTSVYFFILKKFYFRKNK